MTKRMMMGVGVAMYCLSLGSTEVRSIQAQAPNEACWGQATAVFARLGEMGAHASQQANPRHGLGNLARSLYEMGVIEAPTLAALGAYLADVLGLQIQACLADATAVAEAELAAQVHASCWGQASAVFARAGEMGRHASQQVNPRLGLGNFARALYEMGVIEAPTLAALGAFVAAELGLDIEACE